ncbi:MAG: serine hydrolase domain-containing protein [Casimicrobiaceae bacterium]
MLAISVMRAKLAFALFVLTALMLPARTALAVDARTPDPPFPAAKRAAIETALGKSLAETKAPGVVVGIWIPGEGSYVVAKGLADIKTREPMRIADHFRVGSITKTFTATALLILADERKLGLDDPVSKYVSWVPDGDRITLRMLANMTSGLHNYTEDDAWVKKAFSDFQRAWTPRELVDVGIANPPDFPPGKGWHYSNTNYVLLGMILEQVTGTKIQDVFAEKIFKPLKLTHTLWPTNSNMPAPYAHGITVQTLDDKQADATHRNPSWAFTAGALISTLADLRTWVVSYTTGTLVSPAMQRERLTWVTLPPMTPERAYGIGIGIDHGWLGHTGELPGFNCTAYYLPEKKAVIVVMVNSDIPVGKANPAPAIVKALAAVVTPDNVPQ